ncbi:copper resistance system multicopper oxidase [Salinimonas lutimaris]|uniref:copper resistance system multicopper oxidase n=1 Tax=Salinimonas lutimaris TaxID=914153 RepID=UPI0010C03CBD|nr:copper resistance system multicopper oxidase [Salinimonas lutimaris]
MQHKQPLSRRGFLRSALGSASALALSSMAPVWATPAGRHFKDAVVSGNAIDLVVAATRMQVGRQSGPAFTINGQMPGPLVRLKEGQVARLNVTNHLDVDTSVHWHGMILPYKMDGVPGLSFAGIKPGQTFNYEFDVQQSGSYWYHSHSGMQEQRGHLGPLVIDPADGDLGADRDHVILLTDWTFEDPHTIFRHLKVAEGYYNYQQRTLFDTLTDVQEKGLASTWQERSMWGQMRMSPRDLADVTGSSYTYLMNGRTPDDNWTGLFKPGEKVRLRIINGSAMSYFDFRIPGLEMTVVAADGQPVKPVTVDEFRIATAESFDVIVQPKATTAYTLFAESFDRSGFARGTLSPRPGLNAPIPPQRNIAERGMTSMGMDHSISNGMHNHGMKSQTMNHSPAMPAGKMDHGKMDHSAMKHSGKKQSDMKGSGMDHSKMEHSGHGVHESQAATSSLPVDNIEIQHTEEGHGPGAGMIAHNPVSRLDEPGIGLEDAPHRVLVYSDLQGAHAWPDDREPGRQIELHLTGNMERYMWSFDGVKFSEVTGPVHFEYGERLRLVLVNDSMMDHPIHLHGMWMELENGQSPRPRKHTISVKPSEKLSLLISADAPGRWAFHCHLLYHMEAGMFRVVEVSESGAQP